MLTSFVNLQFSSRQPWASIPRVAELSYLFTAPATVKIQSPTQTDLLQKQCLSPTHHISSPTCTNQAHKPSPKEGKKIDDNRARDFYSHGVPSLSRKRRE